MTLFLEYAKRETLDRKKTEGDENDASKKYKNNFVLGDAIEKALDKMVKDAQYDNSKKIPPGFDDFARSQQYKDLLEAMLDYNRELFRLENKQQVLEQEAKQRGLPIP